MARRVNEIANFGFGPTKRSRTDHQASPTFGGNPYNMPKINEVIDSLKKRALGLKHTVEEFFGELHLGEGYGAVQILFCPYGGLKTVIRRRGSDLHGESVWACKHVVVMNDRKYDGHQSLLVEDISQVMGRLVGEEIDSPTNEYPHMARLVTRIGNRVRGLRSDLFIFEGIKKKEEDYYIVQFGVRGHGVEAPGSRRVEQFQINLYYDRGCGYIRSWGNDVSSPTRGHRWELEPAEWNEVFFPSQPVEEIVECHVGQMITY